MHIINISAQWIVLRGHVIMLPSDGNFHIVIVGGLSEAKYYQRLVGLVTSVALSLSCCINCSTCVMWYSHHYYSLTGFSGTHVSPPPVAVSHLDPLQYSSILTASAGILSCLPRLLLLISYPPPTAHHLPAGLQNACIGENSFNVSSTLSGVCHY